MEFRCRCICISNSRFWLLYLINFLIIILCFSFLFAEVLSIHSILLHVPFNKRQFNSFLLLLLLLFCAFRIFILFTKKTKKERKCSIYILATSVFHLIDIIGVNKSTNETGIATIRFDFLFLLYSSSSLYFYLDKDVLFFFF